MSEIKLNPKTLLGFKIVATGESNVKLYSPKIGGKGCQSISDDAALRPAGDNSGAKLR